MAQTGYTPISIYYSATGGNTPLAANLVAGELAINTADGKLFYKDSSGVVQVIAGKGGAGVAGGSNTQVQYNSSGNLAGSANFTFNGTTVTMANDASISGLTVGKGSGSVSNNTVVGYQAAYTNTTGTGLVAVGQYALKLNTTGSYNTAVGASDNAVGGALTSNTTGAYNSAFGAGSLASNTTGVANTALGMQALNSNTTASNNTAVGYQAGYANTTAYNIVAVGKSALAANTTGQDNTGVGQAALATNTTGVNNTSVGSQSLISNTTGSANAALGLSALYTNTTGNYNIGIGQQALYSNTTASNNTAVGYQSLYSNTTGGALAAVGRLSLYSNTTGTSNIAMGDSALYANTTGGSNTALGYQALTQNTTASNNTAVGYQAGYSTTTNQSSAYFGYQSGYAANGNANSFFGNNSGSAVTSGQKNTIIGTFSGNNAGLDIRTASNYIVLSDGDGNPRVIVDNARNMILGELTAAVATTAFIQIGYNGSSQNAFVIKNTTTNYSAYLANFFNSTNGSAGGIWMTGSNATSFVTSSDYRLKKNVAPMQNALNTVAKLKPVTYDWIDGGSSQGFIAHELQEIVPEAVVGEKDAVNEDGSIKAQGIDTSFLVATLTAAIQELKAEVDSLKTQLGK